MKRVTRLPLVLTVTLLVAGDGAYAWQRSNAGSGAWSGVIINGACSAEEAFAEADKCFDKGGPETRFALYDDSIRKVFTLDAQNIAAPLLGDSVTVEGTLEDNAIRVASLKRLTGIGLAVGQKAPSISAQDQFGHAQSLSTLRGPKGTILLFFRSADW